MDVTVGRGEFLSLIGHSGCGNSTLLNVIAGLPPADHRLELTGQAAFRNQLRHEHSGGTR